LQDRIGSQNQRKTTHAITVREKDTCKKWIQDGCPKRKNQGTESSKNSAQVKIRTVASDYETCSTVEIKGTDWWIYNGATKHMTNCPNYFMNFERFEKPMVIIQAGHTLLQAVGAGDVKVKSDVGNKSKMLLLKNVLFVPGLVKNLFSVLTAHEVNPTSKFTSGIAVCKSMVRK
jgi:hypothetical protein